MMAESPVGATIPQYIYHKVATEEGYYPHHDPNATEGGCPNHTTNGTGKGETVNKIVSQWSMYFSVSQCCVNLISVFCLGSLSDKYGRRINFILPPIGDIIHGVIFMLLIQYNAPLPYMFLGLIKNALGTSRLFILGCFTYLADTIEAHKKSFRMTMLDIVLYLCQALSTFCVGLWIKYTHAFWPPYILVISGKFLALLYALFLVPETLDVNNDGRNTRKSFCQSLKSGVTFLYKDNGHGRRWRVWTLLGIYIVSFCLYAADLFHIFVLAAPLCWGTVMYGYYSAYNLIIHCLGALFLTKFLGKVLPDGWQAICGQISSIVMFVYWSFVNNTVMMFFGKYQYYNIRLLNI